MGGHPLPGSLLFLLACQLVVAARVLALRSREFAGVGPGTNLLTADVGGQVDRGFLLPCLLFAFEALILAPHLALDPVVLPRPAVTAQDETRSP